MTINPKLTSEWLHLLDDEFKKPYFFSLKEFLLSEKKQYDIYPKCDDIFSAFNITSFKDIKVVILGQDPYHGSGQAHGLCFSVQDGIMHPPSLKNIFKELLDDIGCAIPKSGMLTHWAEEGVFLINAVLSVRASQANSHRGQGWEQFTGAVIQKISEKKDHVVFILWGKLAQMKSSLIDETKHLILKAPHPSPLSSYRGFFGSKPFSTTNAYLESQNIEPINWCL
ncbi:MAG: uracil-DNA glycosylase [Campylobacterota bacterium]|nr:uracil-DNA glycosylase [Campylobacterota bacterium]